MKTFGLSYWSYWGDQIEDIVCGHTIFLPDLVMALDKLGYKVYALQEDLDKGEPRFINYMVEKRQIAYNLQEYTNDFPELDYLLVEWRWKLPGRNWGEGATQGDYKRQMEIMEHYSKTNTKIFILDTDYKLTKEDEEQYPNAYLIDMATHSKELSRPRHGLFWPFDMDQLKDREFCVHEPWTIQHDNSYSLDPNFIISYIGNNYERDAQFEKYIHQVAQKFHEGTVHVYGNWLKYPKLAIELTEKYYPVVFHPKVNKAHMEYIYSRSYCVPLLSKDDYAQYGQMAYRILEVMYNGSIPVGVKEFNGIDKYVIPELIVGSPEEFAKLIEHLMVQTLEERKALWRKQINYFHYSAEEFIHELESIAAS